MLVPWAAEEHGLARLQLIVEPENLASIRVAEKAGFRREARMRSYIELRGARRDGYMYALLAEDLRFTRAGAGRGPPSASSVTRKGARVARAVCRFCASAK